MATQLGLTNTHYEDPSGLDSRNVSSAYDISHLDRVRRPRIARLGPIMRTAEYEIHTSRRAFSIHSTNKLLGTDMRRSRRQDRASSARRATAWRRCCRCRRDRRWRSSCSARQQRRPVLGNASSVRLGRRPRAGPARRRIRPWPPGRRTPLGQTSA